MASFRAAFCLQASSDVNGHQAEKSPYMIRCLKILKHNAQTILQKLLESKEYHTNYPDAIILHMNFYNSDTDLKWNSQIRQLSWTEDNY